MNLVTREQWGARPPRNRTLLDLSVQHGTAVHYSASDADEQADHANCAKRVRAIQDFHMDGRGWSDIAYSYLACKHGFVYEGRGTGVRTAAQGTDAGNDAYHAVCFLGDDTQGRDDVTDQGRVAIRGAVEHCNAWAGVSAFRPHSWFKPTGCPGDDLRAWLEAGMPITVDLLPEDDMTEDQARKLDAVYRGLITTGTTTIDETIDKLFARVRTVEANVAPTNAALAQLGAQVAELTQLVKGLVLGDLGDVDIRGEFAGTAHVTTPVPPVPVADVQTDAT